MQEQVDLDREILVNIRERNGYQLLNTSIRSKNSGRSESGLGYKVMAATLAMSLLTAPLIASVPDANLASAATTTKVAAPTVKLISESPVTAGATLKNYVWSSTRSGAAVSTNAKVLAIDLHNPHVKLDVMSGVDDQFTKRQTIKGMAKDTAAVAAVNGDYYSVAAEGAPIGPQITSGQFLSSPSYLTGMYAFGLTQDNKPVIDSFQFSGTVTAANGQSHALAGVNKTYYYTDPNKVHSHANALYMYTNTWGSATRANDGATIPTEVLVINDIVTQISDKIALNMIPPVDGYILRASGKAAEYVMLNMQVGDKLTSSYQLIGSNASITDPSNYKMMIGGHTILVNDGKVTAFSRSVSSLGGNRSRTGLGYSKDGRYAYLITVDNKDDSKGMSLAEFQGFMVSVGVWKGLNLDGGGSTQMVSRALGETDAAVVSALENGTARQVVNGLGVYTLAPAGQLKGMNIKGQTTMFLNEKSTFALKAWDEYYNPITTGVQAVQWTAIKGTGAGAFVEDAFTASQAGTATIIATANGIKQQTEIDIIGRNQINSMAFDSSNFILSAGDSYELPVIVATVKGVKRTIPSELLSWEFNGFEGTVQGNVVHVTSIGSTGIARIIARYDGFSTMLTQTAGVDKLFADFDSKSYEPQLQVTPELVLGNVSVAPGLVVGEPDNKALIFEYDFEAGTGTKAVYATFGGSEGVALEGKPDRMKIDVMGDATLNWLRAEFVDANNKSHMIDIANPIDWFGWKSLNIDLVKYKMAYPVKLKRMYVVNPELGQDEREPIGYLAIDNIKLQYEGKVTELKNAKVDMAINRATATVNGAQQKLEQAPTLVNGTTMIPVRFFVDAMGGEVQWDASSQRVTIMRDHHLIEMWIKDNEVIIDGKRYTSEEAPRIMKSRTMLPLRLISEALGWKVGWDAATKSITLQ